MSDAPVSGHDRFAARIRMRLDHLSPVQHRIAAFVVRNPAMVAKMTALEIAAAVGVSDASVVRTCHALGFSGLSGLRRAIGEALGERLTQAGTLRAALGSTNVDAGMSVDMVLEHEARLVANLQRAQTRGAVLDAVTRLHVAGRIVVFGTGASMHLAQYMATMLARHGRRTGVLTASGFSLADQMLSLATGDAIVMLLFGKPYAEAETVVEHARTLGLPMVFITENRHNPLIARSDIAIEIRRVGPTGSPLHGAVLICLESMLMGLAARDDGPALDTLERLSVFREKIAAFSRTGARRSGPGRRR